MIIRAIFIPGGKEKQEVEMEEDSTGMVLLKKLDLPPDAHILVREKIPIPLDEKLLDGESIGIIKVVSGG